MGMQVSPGEDERAMQYHSMVEAWKKAFPWDRPESNSDDGVAMWEHDVVKRMYEWKNK